MSLSETRAYDISVHRVSLPFWTSSRRETLTSIWKRYDIGRRRYIKIDCETKQDEKSLNAFYYHQQTRPTTLDKVDDFARNALFRFSEQDSQRSCWEKSQKKAIYLFHKLHFVFEITITRIIQRRSPVNHLPGYHSDLCIGTRRCTQGSNPPAHRQHLLVTKQWHHVVECHAQ